jgi:hypothetical protein
VVFISSPPGSTLEAIMSGLSPALAAYMAAVYPAGPDPMMITSRNLILSKLVLLGLLAPTANNQA